MPAGSDWAHQQARQLLVAVLAGGSSSSGGTRSSRLETLLRTFGDASAQEYCQGGHGAQAGSSLVVDVAKRLRVFAVIRSAPDMV